MGRRTKLTPELQEALCQLVETGSSPSAAARASGIDPKTLVNWVERGQEAGRGPYYRFYKALMVARGKAEVRMTTIVSLSAERDWRAAMAWLERRAPKEWGPQSKTTLAGDPRHPLSVTAITPEQADEELLRRLREARDRIVGSGRVVLRLAPPSEGGESQTG